MGATSTTGGASAAGNSGRDSGVQRGGRADATVLALLRRDGVTAAEIGCAFDGLGHAARVATVRATAPRDQRRLWSLAQGAAPLGLTDLVPASQPAGREVRHYGKNSLWMFTEFEKRFVRPEGQDPDAPAELHGYNYQSSAIATAFSGPGYFIGRAAEDGSEVLVDYHRVPTTHPEGWPAIVPNDRGSARLVYGHMVDTLRRVSEHVCIGRANRRGKDMDAWFLLCRGAD